MTLEEFYLKEKVRIAKLSRRYARCSAPKKKISFRKASLLLQKLMQSMHAYKLPDGELLKISHDSEQKDIRIYSKRIQAENPKYFGEKT